MVRALVVVLDRVDARRVFDREEIAIQDARRARALGGDEIADGVERSRSPAADAEFDAIDAAVVFDRGEARAPGRVADVGAVCRDERAVVLDVAVREDVQREEEKRVEARLLRLGFRGGIRRIKFVADVESANGCLSGGGCKGDETERGEA